MEYSGLNTQAGFDTNQLEGATLHMLQVFGCLSTESLERFMTLYAYSKGKKLKKEYGSRVLLPILHRENKIWQINNNAYYTPSPLIKPDRKMQDAFWVFLEFFDEVDLNSVMQQHQPPHISFYRKGRLYHIVPVKQEGNIELTLLAHNEIQLCARRKSKDKAAMIEERYLILFTSEEYAKKANYTLEGRTLYGVLTYPDTENRIPKIRLFAPE